MTKLALIEKIESLASFLFFSALGNPTSFSCNECFAILVYIYIYIRPEKYVIWMPHMPGGGVTHGQSFVLT